MRMKDLALAASLVVVPAVAGAVPILPTSYDMLNGQGGTFGYQDESYDGIGNPALDASPLSGGTGDLTDGQLPPFSWHIVPVQWVGWTFDSIITFHFEPGDTIEEVSFWFDDPAGGFGLVLPPWQVTINGDAYAVPDPAADVPFAFTVSGLNLTGDVVVQLFRNNLWVMLGEVSFEGTQAQQEPAPVPEPGTLGLVGVALAGLAIRRRRRT